MGAALLLQGAWESLAPFWDASGGPGWQIHDRSRMVAPVSGGTGSDMFPSLGAAAWVSKGTYRGLWHE